jgi:hypothetical protein
VRDLGGGGEGTHKVIDHERHVLLVERAVGPEARRESLGFRAGLAEDGRLVAQDDEVPIRSGIKWNRRAASALGSTASTPSSDRITSVTRLG